MNQQPGAPLVSCIIAVFNGEAYLHEAIESLLAQTYPSIEVIVVNDGSTDGTADVIGRYGDLVRVVHQSNCGVSIARNRGAAMATGQFLSFLDADDRLDPRKITMQVDAFRAHAPLDFCDCHTAYFWSTDLTEEARQRDFRHERSFWKQALPAHISGWLLRRQLWDRVGGFSASLRYSEDMDWFSRARDLPMRRLTLADVLTYRRLHAGNVTARRRDEQVASLAYMLKEHRVRVRGGPGGDLR